MSALATFVNGGVQERRWDRLYRSAQDAGLGSLVTHARTRLRSGIRLTPAMDQALDRLADETAFAGEVPLPPDAWTGERVAALARHINGSEDRGAGAALGFAAAALRIRLSPADASVLMRTSRPLTRLRAERMRQIADAVGFEEGTPTRTSFASMTRTIEQAGRTIRPAPQARP